MNYIEEEWKAKLRLALAQSTPFEAFGEYDFTPVFELFEEVYRRAREEERTEIKKEWFRANENPESAIFDFGSYLFKDCIEEQ